MVSLVWLTLSLVTYLVISGCATSALLRGSIFEDAYYACDVPAFLVESTESVEIEEGLYLEETVLVLRRQNRDLLDDRKAVREILDNC